MRSGVCYGLVRRTIKPLGNYGEPGQTLSSVHFGVLLVVPLRLYRTL